MIPHPKSPRTSRRPRLIPAPGDTFCLAIFGMLIAAGLVGTIIGLGSRQVIHLAVRQWSEASGEAATWAAALAGLAAGIAAFAYLLFVNPEVGGMIGRFTLAGCCGLVVLSILIGLAGKAMGRW